MKQFKSLVLLFLITTLTFTKNNPSDFCKKGIDRLLLLNEILMIVDQADVVFPEFTKYKFWPEPVLDIKKPQELQFHYPNDATHSVYIPLLINNILSSSLEQNENIITTIIKGAIRTKNLTNICEQNGIDIKSDEFKTFAKKEVTLFIGEKVIKNLVNKIINNTLKEKRKTKRFLKTVLFTAISTGELYINQKISPEKLKPYFPEILENTVNKFVENLFIETVAEIIEYLFIDPPKKEIEEKIKRKHQAILAGHLEHLQNQKLKDFQSKRIFNTAT